MNLKNILESIITVTSLISLRIQLRTNAVVLLSLFIARAARSPRLCVPEKQPENSHNQLSNAFALTQVKNNQQINNLNGFLEYK